MAASGGLSNCLFLESKFHACRLSLSHKTHNQQCRYSIKATHKANLVIVEQILKPLQANIAFQEPVSFTSSSIYKEF